MFVVKIIRSRLNCVNSPLLWLHTVLQLCASFVRMSPAYVSDAPAFGEFRRLSTRLADGIRSFDLPVRTRDVKAALRRNVYDGDGTYINTELTIRSWSAFSAAENPTPSAMENDARPLPTDAT